MTTIEKMKRRLLSNPKVKMHCYPFPPAMNGTPKLSDILEENPDPKYFLSPQQTERIAKSLPAQAVGGPGGATGLYQTGTRIRRLTPLECERLQGFPDNWTAEGINGPISDTQRYKVLGNAVTTNVVEAIVRRFTNVG